MPTTNLPQRFLWSKMQAEAGQSLAQILHRKELERRANAGTFMWGVGNSIGTKIQYIRAKIVQTAIFSQMISAPQKLDATSDDIFLWTAYIDVNGSVRPIPKTHIVTSRANTISRKKRTHFALLVHSKCSIVETTCATLDVSYLRNIGSHALGVGSSQVTALVERHHQKHSASRVYNINFIADLVEPYFVRLAAPMRLESRAYRDFQSALDKTSRVEDFKAEAYALIASAKAIDNPNSSFDSDYLNNTAYGSLIEAL